MGGELVFAGTRVEVKTLVDYLKAGHPLGGFLDDFRTVGRGQAVAYLEIATRAMEESLLLHEAQDGAEREAVARRMEEVLARGSVEEMAEFFDRTDTGDLPLREVKPEEVRLERVRLPADLEAVLERLTQGLAGFYGDR